MEAMDPVEKEVREERVEGGRKGEVIDRLRTVLLRWRRRVVGGG